jgi:hypothetical protein
MKMQLICKECFELFKETRQEFPSVYNVPVNDEGFYTFKCKHDHTAHVLFEQPKFELLFEIAIQAIVDGYNRDAVASFAASLERTMEFYCRVIMHSMGRGDQFEIAWGAIKNASERQLGYFCALYGIQSGGDDLPILPTGKKGVEFRNSVVHKGRIPSEDEAIEFGELVLRNIVKIVAPLHAEHSEAIEKVTRPQKNAEHIEKNTMRMRRQPLIQWLVGSTEPMPTVRELLGHAHIHRDALDYMSELGVLN